MERVQALIALGWESCRVRLSLEEAQVLYTLGASVEFQWGKTANWYRLSLGLDPTEWFYNISRLVSSETLPYEVRFRLKEVEE